MKKIICRVSIIISILVVLMKERRRICHLVYQIKEKLIYMRKHKQMVDAMDERARDILRQDAMMYAEIDAIREGKIEYHPEDECIIDECIICE